MAEELLINFLGTTALADDSNERALNQVACHIFLLTSVLNNLAYLIFVAGFGIGSLKRNPLQQLALLGALMQLGSCYNSISRYNIGDEYHFNMGNMGSLFGLLSGIFNNSALSTIWFHKRPNRKFKWMVCSIFIVLLSTCAMIIQLNTYEDTKFFYFRIINICNTPYTMICCLFTYRALKSGKITINENIIKHEDVTNLFLVMFVFELFWFLMTFFGIPWFMYMGGGLTFGVVNVATHFMGNFDDYYDWSPKSTSVEHKSSCELVED